VVLARVFHRLPRFIAKATLTKVPGVGPLLRSLGVVFVQRRVDGPEGTTNTSAFVQCHKALAKGDTVAIFPEGTTHDRPHLDPIRTGAARIVLGTAGAQPPLIVPVGLTYPDKYANRSSVLVEFGEPIDPAVVVPDAHGEDDHEAVDALTAVIDQRLRSVSPDFQDVEDWLTFDSAASVAARVDGEVTPTLASRARLARGVARADTEQQDAVRAAMGRYAAILAPLRLTDPDVADPTRSPTVLRAAIVAGIWVVLAGAWVLATILVNAIPFLLVILAGLRTKVPVTKGTVRVLVGLVTFPIAWVVGAVLACDDWWQGILWFVAFAVGAAAVVVLVDRALALGGSVFTWYVVRERAAAIDIARVVRQDVIDAVDAIAITTPQATPDPRWRDRARRRRAQPPSRSSPEQASPPPGPEQAPAPAP